MIDWLTTARDVVGSVKYYTHILSKHSLITACIV